MARDSLEGKYILQDDMDNTGYGTLSILRERYDDTNRYETIIPDAGKSRAFAIGLVDLLNRQGSEAGPTSE